MEWTYLVNIERLKKSFLELVQIDSPSGKEGNIAKYLYNKLEDLGLDVIIDNAGSKVGGQVGNVIGHLKANTQGTPIIFSSHMDTVMPGIGVKPKVVNNTIYSDGTTVLGSDDKAGIASILEGIQIIQEDQLPHAGIEVAFTIWEEGGLFGSKNLNYDILNGKYCIVLDSSGELGKIVTSAPAQNKLDVKIIGKSAHAGVSPEKGISAIMIAAKAISEMQLLRINESTTANIGIINGGKATNIVPDEVNIKAEVRSLCSNSIEAQTDHMIDIFKCTASDFGGTVEINLINNYPAFHLESNHDLVEIVKKSLSSLGIKPHISSSGGGSDANIFNNKGIPAVNLSIGYRNPHTTEEYISIEDIANIARFMVQLTQDFTK